MALSEKRRQRKIERKNKKRKQLKKPLSIPPRLGHRAAGFGGFPVHECLVPSGLFETGVGTVIVARKAADGNIALGAFLVDVYCLGVKDAMFNIVGELEYEQSIKARFIASHQGQHYEQLHVACARKLIEGAVAFAENHGFSPHRDYRDAKNIFGDADASACPVRFTYGMNGKPFYMRGPYESASRAKRILETLHKTCGEGGYDYFVPAEGNIL